MKHEHTKCLTNCIPKCYYHFAVEAFQRCILYISLLVGLIQGDSYALSSRPGPNQGCFTNTILINQLNNSLEYPLPIFCFQNTHIF